MTAAGPSIIEPSITRTPSRTGYLPTLDGWRAVAILLVIAHHAAISARAVFGEQSASWLRPFLVHGRVGVQIFFGISGLLICTRLISEYRSDNRVDLKRFYIRRAYRILPPLVVFLLVAGVLGLSGVLVIKRKDWLAATFFLANYVPIHSWYLSHFWSLAMEEHFYLFFPPILSLGGVRRGLWLTLILALIVVTWRGIDLGWLVTAGSSLTTARERTDTACDGLLWGCIIALLYDRPNWRRRFARALNPAVVIALLMAFVAVTMLPATSLRREMAILAVQAFMIPLLLVGTVSHPASLIGILLEFPPLRWVGRLSYSLYLWQQIFLAWRGSESPMMGNLQAFPWNVMCAFAAAMGSYYLIERPFVRRGRQLTGAV